MKRAKKILYVCLGCLSKKGALILGLIAGLVLALFLTCVNVFAAVGSLGEVPIGSELVSFTTQPMYLGTTDLSSVKPVTTHIVKQSSSSLDLDYLTNVCFYSTVEFENKHGLGTCYRFHILVTDDFRDNYYYYSVKGESEDVPLVFDFYNNNYDSLCISDSSIPFYKFSSLAECQSYLKGEIDASTALNYDEIQNASVTYYDSADVPYYDDCTIIMNTDKTCSYSAVMSQTEQMKIVENTTYTYDYETYAIYGKRDDLGAYNSFFIMYGNDKNLLDNALFNKKLDKLIDFDEAGRLIVQEKTGASHSGGGGRHGDVFSYSTDSSLIAYQVDAINDEKLTYSLQRNVTGADTYIYDDNYILMGYYSAIYVTAQADGSSERYVGYESYSYTWVTNALRKKFGSGTNVISGKVSGTDTIETDKSYSFDSSSGEKVSSSDSDLNTGNLQEYIKNGYGLTGTDGYIELSRRFFLGVPAYIWAIIATALSVNLVVIVFKVVRGM